MSEEFPRLTMHPVKVIAGAVLAGAVAAGLIISFMLVAGKLLGS